MDRLRGRREEGKGVIRIYNGACGLARNSVRARIYEHHCVIVKSDTHLTGRKDWGRKIKFV